MKGLKKATVISVVLLLPVLVFLFLKKYGTNEFDLPIYYLEGSPLVECDHSPGPHTISTEFTSNYSLELPVLIHFESRSRNNYSSDLENVLQKYNEINNITFSQDSLIQAANFVALASKDYLNVLNCELVMGEDRYLIKHIEHKYILIDSARQIRGYFKLSDLDDIQRLDMELDIVLNY